MQCPLYKDYPLYDGYRDLAEKWIRNGFAIIKKSSLDHHIAEAWLILRRFRDWID